MRQYELVERVKSYDPSADEDALNRAYVFAMKMHSAQVRESGEPYFSHPVSVAEILTEYRFDSSVIITALLHDTVEDTPASYADIKELFGEDIARLVRGLTKLSKVQLKSDATEQAENWQKLVLAISEDIRVLVIKLADRLHNMRTLSFCKKPEKRQRIARETMEIYVPLAERIGMQKLKDELEDYAFKELHPEAYESIATRLSFLAEQGKNDVAAVIAHLSEDLKENKIQGEIEGREKRPYSIWRKMQRQNIPFEQIFDIMAFRIIVGTIAECYQTLGAIHTKYPMIPGRYKDYISTPKQNGYKSLHTGVIGPLGRRIEVQIRTREMHEAAEYGIAAHWEYKQGASKEGSQYRWLRNLLDLMQHSSDSNDFLEHTKIALYQDQIFCFSPKGDLMTLPKGATAIDFAYAIHSRIGDSCVGAKINGKMKPLRSVLQNGDQVEILTAKNQTPPAEWERIVVTAKAKASIRRFARAQKKQAYIALARDLFNNAAKEDGIVWSPKDLTPLLSTYRQETPDDLLATIGEGLLPFKDIFRQVYPENKLTLRKAISLFSKKKNPTAGMQHTPIIGIGNDVAFNFGKCCHPVPGDAIVGIVTTGKGITIHTQDCPTLTQLSEEPERWLDISWNPDAMKDKTLPVRIKVTFEDKNNALTEIMNAISQCQVQVSNLNTVSRVGGWSEVYIDVEIKSAEQLDVLLQALRSLKFVSSVYRVKN